MDFEQSLINREYEIADLKDVLIANGFITLKSVATILPEYVIIRILII